MQNSQTWVAFSRNSESLPWKNGTSTGTIVCGTSYIGARCERVAQRTFPPALLPQYGTTSWSRKASVSCSNGQERNGFNFAPSGLMYGDSANRWQQALGIMDNQISQSSLLARLDTKVIEKIMGDSGQLANDILELRKTRDMAGNALLGLWQGLRGLRRGAPLKEIFKTLRKEGYLGTMGNKWLETIYGWIPTIDGAYQTADLLAAEWSTGKIYTGHTSVREDFFPRFAYDRFNFSSTSRGKAKAHYQYMVSDPNLVRMRSLGLTNLAAIVWEATPWSFVLDWGLKFGQYLQAMDYALGLSGIWVQKTIRLEHGWSAEQFQPFNSGYKIEKYARGQGSFSYSDRKAPTQSLSATWKGFHNPFGSQNASARLTSAMALLYQQRHLFR